MTGSFEKAPSATPVSSSRAVIAPRGHWAWKGGGAPHALRLGNIVYVGGQMSLNATGDIVGANNIEAQTANAFENLSALLREAGTSMEELMKLHTYYLFGGESTAATEYWERMTRVRLKYLADPGPAATAVRVKGVPTSDQMIGIDGIAVIGGDKFRIMPKHRWDWSMPTPFSQGWKVGNKVFVGGQISADMKGKTVAANDVGAQTRNIMGFIHAVLVDGGAEWRDLVTLKICYKHSGSDKNARALSNEILDVVRDTIPAPRPALTAFGVDLLYEGLVLEIDGFAVLGEKTKIVPPGSATWVSMPSFEVAWRAGSEIYLGAICAPGGAGLQAQAEASIERVRRTLLDAGADFRNLVKVTVFFVAGPEDATGATAHQIVAKALDDYFPSPGPVVTIVRVPGLHHEGQLFQIDGLAVCGSS